MPWSRLPDRLLDLTKHQAQLKAQGHYSTRFASLLLTKKLLAHFHAELYIRDFEQLKQHPGKRVLLIPNHRSYLDPLLVHYILTLQGHPQPRVIALDFLAATPLAPLMKQCGALFIKSSFAQSEYRERMNTQFREIVDQGEMLSFYLEGQRSVSGKQMEPRRGLLTALLDRDCVIYPLNLSFERLIEDREFISKQLAFDLGATAKSFFTSNRGMGRIFCSLGAPILTPAGTSPRSVADRLTAQIMTQNVLFTTDLVAAILLDRQETMPLEELEREVGWLATALRERGIQVSERPVVETLRLLKHVVRKQSGLVSIRDKALLIYYRNRMLYTLADLTPLPSLLRKEALWTPSVAVTTTDRPKLSTLAERAFAPTITLYTQLVNLISQGERSVRALRKAVDQDPHYCYETVRNLVSTLIEDGVITTEGDIITVL